MKRPFVLFVVGPTATGKSDLAVEISEGFDPILEIVNCDSVQFFAGLEIGSARPGPELLLRAPHRLVGHVGLGGDYTAGDFRRDALAVVERGGRYVAVGGSGFYVQALEKGMYDVPEIPAGLREELESEADAEGGLEALYREFTERDAEAAAKVSVRDRYRVIRALEILRSSPGETLSSMKARFKAEPSFDSTKIGLTLDRELLRERVQSRTRVMLARGLVAEVEALLRQGLRDWAPLRSVGYREVVDLLEGRLASSELEAQIVTSTMQLARKQMTWFKRDTSIQWFEATPEGRARACERGREFILQAMRK